MAITVPDNYSVDDFKQALQKLLPPGEYWQNQTPDTDLDKLLKAIATEFKTTHDETKLSVLIKLDEALFGWKISDYQNLLDVNGINGKVFDHPSTPNLIYIELEQTKNVLDVVRQIEDVHLPHTQLVWRYAGGLNITAVVRATVYKRLELEG
ncbi:MAG: hypothetical protein HUJ13_01610 [Hydrogenovibrio crunogenus]|nr:hypothetical protein [Hydrogenovibrio crunogenus]